MRKHQNLVDRVAGSDPDAAEAAMRKHVRCGLEDIEAAIALRFGPVMGRLQPLRAVAGAGRLQSRHRGGLAIKKIKG